MNIDGIMMMTLQVKFGNVSTELMDFSCYLMCFFLVTSGESIAGGNCMLNQEPHPKIIKRMIYQY